MPRTSRGERSEGEAVHSGGEELSKDLPLDLIRGQIVPPAPNRQKSAIDWLHDFGGFSWIAFGASSLLVISHCPSPTSGKQICVGPFFKQVIEPSLQLPSQTAAGDNSPSVKAVAWCHSAPSDGVVAAGLGDHVFVYHPSFSNGKESLCWRQKAVLVHSFVVEAIEWTKSGDGLIAVGDGVVSWKKESSSWRMSWKLQLSVAQTLVSTTWSTNGPVATALHQSGSSGSAAKLKNSPLSEGVGNKVSVFFGECDSQVVTLELDHPGPVSMIQWRPLSNKDSAHSWRDVLLTCCFDGAVRLWSEIDCGSTKRCSKDVTRKSFHVISVIEINNCLKGIIGKDVFISWVPEIWGKFPEYLEPNFSLTYLDDDHVGRCDWLIGVGPDFSVSFFSVHCLDDLFPLRLPRVRLWGKYKLMESRLDSFPDLNNFLAEGEHLVVRAIVWRNSLSDPPDACSVLRLSPDNIVSWSSFARPVAETAEAECLVHATENEILPHYAEGFLLEDSHEGRILRVAVHPCSCDMEIAVSLDSKGHLLFWSFSTTTDYASGLNMMPDPVCQFIGKITAGDMPSGNRYPTLTWTSSVICGNRFLLLGGAEGIDCVQITLSREGRNKMLYEKLFTISFSDLTNRCRPDYVGAVPLASTCDWPFTHDSFMVVAAWMNEFQVIAWKIILQSDDGHASLSTVEHPSYDSYLSKSSGWKHEWYFNGKRYIASIDICAIKFPDCDSVSCFAALSPDRSHCCGKHSSKYIHRTSSMYHIVTGHSDGRVRLWRSASLKCLDQFSDENYLPWELVGMFSAHSKPVRSIALSDCGTKIATTSMEPSNESSDIYIWQFICQLGGGGFMLEDRVSLHRNIVTLKWATLGNGSSLLAVCMPNKFCLYSPKRSRDHKFKKSGKPEDMQKWVCVALSQTYSTVQEFVWGPGLRVLLVHEKHLSVFSKWAAKLHGQIEVKDKGLDTDVSETSGEFSCGIFFETGASIVDELLKGRKNEVCSTLVTEQGTIPKVDNFGEYLSYLKEGFLVDSEFQCTAKVADECCSSLPSYHPQTLLVHLFSGNWKRAYGSVRHLVECLNSSGCTSSSSSFSVQEVNLSEYFGEKNPMEAQGERFQWGHDISRASSSVQGLLSTQSHSLESFPVYKSSPTSQGAELVGFIDTLQRSFDVRAIMNIDRTELLAVVDLLDEIVNPQNTSIFESFDKPGRRFWVSLRFQYFHFLRKEGKPAAQEDMKADSSDIAWAFQSDYHDSLISSLLLAESSWKAMQNIGVGFWLTNAAQLRSRMEKLARLQYLTRKDPKDCALLYIALNRLQVLAGLFKLSKDGKDKAMVGFLSRNFQEEKNKLAALKNAYVLMGKHQLELAVAFFLLGGDASSAITVCAKNLGDEQLALVICRLVQGCGGPLENQLISSILLPNALEKRDFWLASMLECSLGNWANSFKRLLTADANVETDNIEISYDNFSVADVSEYLVMLSAKNGLRNSVGDRFSAVLSHWAASMRIYAFFRSGLSLEALECISTSSTSEGKNQPSARSVEKHGHLSGMNPFSSNSCNWLTEDVACHLEHSFRLNISMQYISKLFTEHLYSTENQLQMEKSHCRFRLAVSKFAERYSVNPADLMDMMLVSADNHDLLSHAYHILHRNISQESAEDETHLVDTCPDYSGVLSRLGKSIEETCYFVSRYVSSISFTSSGSILDFHGKVNSDRCYHGTQQLRGIIRHLRGFRPLLGQSTGPMPKDFIRKTYLLLDLLEIFIHFALAWVQRDLDGLISLTLPVLNSLKSTNSFVESSGGNIAELLRQSSPSAAQTLERNIKVEQKECESNSDMVSEDEQWHVIGVSLWRKISAFFVKEVGLLIFDSTEDESIASDMTKTLSFFSSDWMISSLAFISSSLTRCLRSSLKQKARRGLTASTLIWLQEYRKSTNKEMSIQKYPDNVDEKSPLRMLWEISTDPEEILACFSEEEINGSGFLSGRRTQTPRWSDSLESLLFKSSSDFRTRKGEVSSAASISETKKGFLEDQRGKPTSSREGTDFRSPREVYKRNGELLEAICFNSSDEGQVAVASNRKGLVFFDWKATSSRKADSQYIWMDSDWPSGGWAGSESTPIPTFVSPGVGLGSQKGTHLGLGGATVGLEAIARPGREVTGFGAFGVPGYAGIAASGLGWGEPADFEEFKDPPATVENIRTRALCSHPSKPLLLVGSSNTHVYLWEFGEERATATYGVLPAANVPPPYALASISAVQFDLCGHRFATAALDGTVCAWQLEVGGRSNVRPTDSSLCFNKHASAVAYVAASGSIIAAAGHSTTNANVIIWDTLAPPTASHSYLTCHDGGARSLSVLENDVGSGSMCPLLIAGGKNGDIALYDIRYVMNGRNANGMIWRVPSAHQGSVTKIAAVPRTGLILTGGKDGDVKLWDARRGELLFLWQRMHERHTFLQPSSRGFGGIARAAVTDIQVMSNGFMTCGGDGSVKLVKLTKGRFVFHALRPAGSLRLSSRP